MLGVRHLGVLLGYLEQVLRKLLENKIASARQTIRLAAKVHWDRKMLGAIAGGQGAWCWMMVVTTEL